MYLQNLSAEQINAIKVRFQKKVFETPTCWLWKGKQKADGYGLFWLNQKRVRAHRLVFELYRGDIPAGMIICHTCDNPSCVNPAHLFVGTDAINAVDRDVKDRGASALTYRQVAAIRALKGHGITHKELGRIYGVGRSCITKILNHSRWKANKYSAIK